MVCLDSYKGKCCYVGADARQSGTYQGELILETPTQGDINGDGKMTGTVLNDDVGQATAAAAATKLYVEGKDVEEYYWVDYVKVTKDNASQYLK